MVCSECVYTEMEIASGNFTFKYIFGVGIACTKNGNWNNLIKQIRVHRNPIINGQANLSTKYCLFIITDFT